MIRQLGAEAVFWSAGGRNRLWSADTAIWERTSPVLFPIVGRLRDGVLSIGGRRYPMSAHGFAASSWFSVVERSSDAVLLRLEHSEPHTSFPFAFILDVGYQLTGEALTISFSVTNLGSPTLPYALGLHPGFAWPFSADVRDGHSIEFERAECADVPRITSDGLFSRMRRTIPLCGRVLPVDDALFVNEALCFLNARSKSLRFIAPDGASIRMSAENFSHFALWTKPGAPFLSMEAWTGHGDPDSFAGDVAAKPSMRFLASGAIAHHAIRLSYEAAA